MDKKHIIQKMSLQQKGSMIHVHHFHEYWLEPQLQNFNIIFFKPCLKE
jgi:hypothetical protein